MKFSQAVEVLGKAKARKVAMRHAQDLGIAWNDGIGVVFEACLVDSERQPSIGWAIDSEVAAIERWVKKYKHGYDSRPSQAAGKPPQTVPDSIVDEIIAARLNLSKREVQSIRYAHRLSMSAENILGLFLEEFLALRLAPHGWYCAWGETLRSVDFCHSGGRLLQIKNRSNTENSSSNKVRSGTKIEKWFRVDAATGRYLWECLKSIAGVSGVSEDDFKKFVVGAIKKNPASLGVDEDSLWLQGLK